MKLKFTLLGLFALCSCAALADPKVYRQLIERRAGAIVTVSFSMSADMMGQQQRMRGEVEGTVLKGGIVLVPSVILNPMDLAREFMAQSEGGESDLPNMSTGEIKIKLPGMDEPMEAEVLTQDRDFGIAWLKLKQTESSIKGLDLDESARPVIGEAAYALALTPELYGYAPYVLETVVQGEIKVPFPSFMVGTVGKALFNRKGLLIGYSVPKFVGGSMSGITGEAPSFGLLIPAARLRELTARALNRAEKSSR